MENYVRGDFENAPVKGKKNSLSRQKTERLAICNKF